MLLEAVYCKRVFNVDVSVSLCVSHVQDMTVKSKVILTLSGVTPGQQTLSPLQKNERKLNSEPQNLMQKLLDDRV